MNFTLNRTAKVSLSVYFIYIFWFVYGVAEIRILLHGVTFLATACVLQDAAERRRLYIPRVSFFTMMFVYGIYALVTGFLVARRRNMLIAHLITYFLVFVICFDCCYVSHYEKSMEWLAKAVAAAAALTAFQLILFPYYDPVEGRASLGPTSNPNVLGVIIVIGIFFLVHRRESMERMFLPKMLLILIMLYAILKTGSRKSLVAGAVIFVIWFLSYMKAEVRPRMRLRTVFSLLLLLLLLAVVFTHFTDVLMSTAAFDRMNELVVNHGSRTRTNLYQEAFEVWKDHPILGVGYAQFSLYSSNRHISHSTYMEILSCTGLAGFLVVFVPVGILGWRLLRNLFSRKRWNRRYEDRLLLALFAVELFLGVGQEWFYYTSNIIAMLFLSWNTACSCSPNPSDPVQFELN